jgi:hypothetical protein
MTEHTWAMVTDLCLELAWAREQLYDDELELMAVALFFNYLLLGGQVTSLAAWRHKVRSR